jgi:hypothetical protein
MQCEHYACRCARAAELAAMGELEAAVAVHFDKVTCREAPRERDTESN